MVPNKSTGAIIHDQLFAILYSSIGVCLVNYVLMSSAADTMDDTGLLVPNYQDALSLMNQIFMSLLSPCLFFFIFLFSSLITALTRNLGAQMVLLNFFNTQLPSWVHDMTAKALAIIPAVYCIQSEGDEGLYQLLLFSQIILAMLIPSAVIPLFRISSTKSIMGAFRLSWNLKILAVLSLVAILVSNLAVIIKLFGYSGQIANAREGMETGLTLPYIILILVAFISFSFTLHLLLTPLKSSNVELEAEICKLDLQKDRPQQSQHREENACEITLLDEDQEVYESALDHPLEEIQSDNPTVDSNVSLPEEVNDVGFINVHIEDDIRSQEERPLTDMGFIEMVEEVPSVNLMDGGNLLGIDIKDSHRKNMEEETNAYSNKHGKQVWTSQTFKSSSTQIATASQPTTVHIEEEEVHLQEVTPIIDLGFLDVDEEVPSLKGSQRKNAEEETYACTGKDDKQISTASQPTLASTTPTSSDNKSNIGSKSAMSRSTIRRLADFLNEFWSHLFDYHGGLSDEGKYVRADFLLNLDISVTAALKDELVRSYMTDCSLEEPEMKTELPENLSIYGPMVGSGSSSGHTNRYPSSCDVSLSSDTNGSLKDPSGYDPMDRIYSDLVSEDQGIQSTYNVHSRSRLKRGTISSPLTLNTDPTWARQPFEQHFTPAIYGKPDKRKRFLSYGQSESIVIMHLRACLARILKLEGSIWLFTQNGSCDEEIVDLVATTEKSLKENASELMEATDIFGYVPYLPGCRDCCVWQAALVKSFGVWCIRRILALLVMENRPEIWGKYTFVLNRLQGIIEPAFFKERDLIKPCKCLPENLRNDQQNTNVDTSRNKFTTAAQILGLIKEVEANLFERRGRTATCFIKGKENLFSVLKRYKRHFSKKPTE